MNTQKKLFTNFFPHAILAFAFIIALLTAVNAATFTVTNTNDSGEGSLRQAVENANNTSEADVINFDSGVFSTAQTIVLASEMLVENAGSLTINGTGADKLTIDGNNSVRAFFLNANAVLTVNGIQFANGNVTDQSNYRTEGGAIFQEVGSTLNVNACYFHHNTAISGGAISNRTSTLNITASSFISNSATAIGGAVNVVQSSDTNAVITILNSTFDSNTANDSGGAIRLFDYELDSGRAIINLNFTTFTRNFGSGGAIYNYQGVINTQNSIFSDNQSPLGQVDIFSVDIFSIETNSSGYNLISTDALGFNAAGDIVGFSANLQAANDNGGTMPTVAPNANSPAINAAEPNTAITTDQRGMPRPLAGRADIGAFETSVNPSDVSLQITAAPDPAERGANLTYTITAINISAVQAAMISLTADVPGYATFVSLAAPQNFKCTTPAMGETGMISCSGAAIAANSSINFTLVVNVGADLPFHKQIKFQATVSAANDTNSINDTVLVQTDASGGTFAFAGNGNYQGAGINTTFGQNLEVSVTDGVGTPLSGVTVTFTAPEDGASGTFAGGATTATATTGANGIATAPAFTANGTSGDYIVTAAAKGATETIEFYLTNTVPMTFIVTNTNDDGEGSFREAVDLANNNPGDDTINFDSTVFSTVQTISLTSEVSIYAYSDLTINGPGANLLTISGDSNYDTLYISSGSSGGDRKRTPQVVSGTSINNQDFIVNISGIQFTNAGFGAIYQDSDSTLNITACYFHNNSSQYGGAIYSYGGTLNIKTSTFSQNNALYYGGAIYAAPSGEFNATVNIENSTIAGNTVSSEGSGGGILIEGGGFPVAGTRGQTPTATLNLNFVTISNNSGGVVNLNGAVNTQNSIFAANTDPSQGARDVSGTVNSLGYNLVSNTTGSSGFSAADDLLNQDAMLQSLGNYGGTTPTAPPSETSPAVNNADTNSQITIDQRGFSRPARGQADIGAVELQNPTTADLSVTLSDSPDPVRRGENLTYTIIVNNPTAATANDFSLTTFVPDYTTFVTLTSPAGFSCTAPAVGGMGNINCLAATIAGNSSNVLTLIVKVNANAPGNTNIEQIVNIAAMNDNNSANNRAAATTDITGGTFVFANGDYQSTAVNTTFQRNLSVTVVDDNYSPVAGATVTFAAPTSGASGTFAGGATTATVISGENGSAEAPAFTANGMGGNYLITASFEGAVQQAQFHLANILSMNYVVTNTNDSGAGSLRDAVEQANENPADDTINFDPNFFSTPQTIVLTQGSILIEDGGKLTINGAGAGKLTISGGSKNRIFEGFNVNLALNDLKLADGFGGDGDGFDGGGAMQFVFSTIQVNRCAFYNNSATGSGGAILALSTALNINQSTFYQNQTNRDGGALAIVGIKGGRTTTITNSTFNQNSAISNDVKVESQGGAIYKSFDQSQDTILNMTSVTIAGNSATSAGGGVYSGDSNFNFINSIVAGNASGGNMSQDIGGTVNSQGFNLIQSVSSATFANGAPESTDITGVDPLLGTLGGNGGATETMKLQTGSPAVDKGTSANVGGRRNAIQSKSKNLPISRTRTVNSPTVTTDQRGVSRPVDNTNIPNADDGSDIGAYELVAAPTAASVEISGSVLTPGGSGLRNAIVVLTDEAGQNRAVYTGVSGNFQFENVEAGHTYIISVNSKRYQFAPQVINVTGQITDLQIIALTP